MTTYILDIPETLADRARWLEGHLTGPRLPDLVTELLAVTGPGDKGRSLEEAIGPSLGDVLEKGLGVLDDDQLHQLMIHPHLLFDLQDRIFVDGGSYWFSQPLSESEKKTADEAVQAILSKATASEPLAPPTTPIAASRPESRSRRWWILGASVGIAAAILLAIGPELIGRPSERWGWQRTDAFTQVAAAPDYLNRLADLASEYFDQPRGSKQELRQAIEDFRIGCDLLLKTDHGSLAQLDRYWLLERCRVWSGKFDQQLADIDQGQSIDLVRAAADETVNKLINALRDRAKSAST
jgi:hypothetical protein